MPSTSDERAAELRDRRRRSGAKARLSHSKVVPPIFSDGIDTPEVTVVLRSGGPMLIAVVFAQYAEGWPRKIEPPDPPTESVAHLVATLGFGEASHHQLKAEFGFFGRFDAEAHVFKGGAGAADATTTNFLGREVQLRDSCPGSTVLCAAWIQDEIVTNSDEEPQGQDAAKTYEHLRRL